MTKTEAKDIIQNYEYYANGFHRLSGVDVLVRNVRLTKTHAIADIILITDAECGNSERYNQVKYPLEKLEELKIGV